MERLTIVLSAVIVVTTILSQTAYCETHNDDRSLDAYSKRKSTAVWFGPRLGRRKRNPNGAEDSFRNPAVEREQLEALMEIIQESPWALVAVNGKRHTVSFTPRLGRESGEDMGGSGSGTFGGDRWIQDPELGGELMFQRSPPFAPRLGRRLLPFSPRLGRETDKS